MLCLMHADLAWMTHPSRRRAGLPGSHRRGRYGQTSPAQCEPEPVAFRRNQDRRRERSVAMQRPRAQPYDPGSPHRAGCAEAMPNPVSQARQPNNQQAAVSSSGLRLGVDIQKAVFDQLQGTRSDFSNKRGDQGGASSARTGGETTKLYLARCAACQSLSLFTRLYWPLSTAGLSCRHAGARWEPAPLTGAEARRAQET